MAVRKLSVLEKVVFEAGGLSLEKLALVVGLAEELAAIEKAKRSRVRSRPRRIR